MNKLVGYLNAAFLLIFSLLPLAVLLQFIPSYIANPAIPPVFYWLAAGLFVVAVILMFLLLRQSVVSPKPGREMTRKKAIWTGIITGLFYAAFIPTTVLGAGPAVLSYFRHEKTTLTLPIKDATVSAGRRSCEGRVELDGLWFLSTVCGVPEDLRSQMKPGDDLELTGQGHSMGLRVEEVRLIPKG